MAWIALAVYVVAWDTLSDPDEMLSIGVDRYLVKSPVITHAVVGVTALHLLNYMPRKLDPFYLISSLFGR